MTGRFNQNLPENLHTAFKKAANFEPRIITKQSIHERKVHNINHIDVAPCQDEIEINEAHIQNPNYNDKNYDPNYQQNKNKHNFNNNSNPGPTTKTMETRAKEITIARTTIRRSQSIYQLC